MSALHTMDVPLRVPRADLIRLFLHCTAALTTVPPVVRVPLADLQMWAGHLGAARALLQLRPDGRVFVSITEPVGDKGLLQVDAVVDVVRDVELPPVGSGSVSLPVDQLWRLEAFRENVTGPELLAAVRQGEQ